MGRKKNKRVDAPSQSLRGETQVFTGVLAVHDDLLRYDMVGPEATAASEEVAVQLVSGEYFEVLGVRPALGRTFGKSDNTAADPGLVVLSDEFWTRAHHEYLARGEIARAALAVEVMASGLIKLFPGLAH